MASLIVQLQLEMHLGNHLRSILTWKPGSIDLLLN